MKKRVLFAFVLIIAQIYFPTQVFADSRSTTPTVQSIIGSNPVSGFVGGPGQTLGTLISNILSLVFAIAGIVSFVWAFIGVFQYITAGGNKEGLGKARGRITWALIGLVFIMISFSLSQYVRDIFRLQDITIPPISPTS